MYSDFTLTALAVGVPGILVEAVCQSVVRDAKTEIAKERVATTRGEEEVQSEHRALRMRVESTVKQRNA